MPDKANISDAGKLLVASIIVGFGFAAGNMLFGVVAAVVLF